MSKRRTSKNKSKIISYLTTSYKLSFILAILFLVTAYLLYELSFYLFACICLSLAGYNLGCFVQAYKLIIFIEDGEL